MPAWLFLPYIIAVIGGSLGNNVPTYYSSGLMLRRGIHVRVPRSLFPLPPALPG